MKEKIKRKLKKIQFIRGYNQKVCKKQAVYPIMLIQNKEKERRHHLWERVTLKTASRQG